MAVYWLTEVVPLAVTSFLPIFLFPLLGVLPVGEICANYLKVNSIQANLAKNSCFSLVLLSGPCFHRLYERDLG